MAESAQPAREGESVGVGMERFATRTPTLPPATTTNSYALGSEEVLLVEPASPYEEERRSWLEWAHGLESKGRRLRAIFVTHHHPDHVGGAAFFSQQLGLPLWGHSITAELLPELRFERQLHDGESLALGGPSPQRWRCLHTPGHAPGHLCLHEESTGAMVVGDMVASEGTILIAPGDGDLRLYLQQLARLAALDASLALPAHGAPIDSPTATFERYLAHRLMREQRVVEALAAIPAGGSLDDLVSRAYQDTPASLWPLAKLSLESHLVKLSQEGRAIAREGRWWPGAC